LRAVVRAALVLALVLLLATPAAHAATRAEILRDCQDGSLAGTYTAGEIRDARSNIPADIDQYSDCRDVLTRALTSGATGGGTSGGDGGTSGGDGGDSGGGDSGGGGSGGGSTDGGAAAGGGGAPSAAAPAAPIVPSTPEERGALDEAVRTGGAEPVAVGERPVVPGATAFDAGTPGNRLPDSLVVTLILLAAAALLVAAPVVRRRVVDHRHIQA
jgi:hypothetical protein